MYFCMQFIQSTQKSKVLLPQVSTGQKSIQLLVFRGISTRFYLYRNSGSWQKCEAMKRCSDWIFVTELSDLVFETQKVFFSSFSHVCNYLFCCYECRQRRMHTTRNLEGFLNLLLLLGIKYEKKYWLHEAGSKKCMSTEKSNVKKNRNWKKSKSRRCEKEDFGLVLRRGKILILLKILKAVFTAYFERVFVILNMCISGGVFVSLCSCTMVIHREL